MKQLSRYLLLPLTFFCGLFVYAAVYTDPIEGFWFNETKEAKIQIYKSTDGKFYGKIVWLKIPLKDGKPKLDEKNPDNRLKKQPIVSLLILKGFEKDGEQYTEGTIYDPDNGKTYDCKMT